MTGVFSLWSINFLGSGISWFIDIRVSSTIWKTRYIPTFQTSSSPFSHCSPGMKHHTIFRTERTIWFVSIKDTLGNFCNVLIKVIGCNSFLLSRTVVLDLYTKWVRIYCGSTKASKIVNQQRSSYVKDRTSTAGLLCLIWNACNPFISSHTSLSWRTEMQTPASSIKCHYRAGEKQFPGFNRVSPCFSTQRLDRFHQGLTWKRRPSQAGVCFGHAGKAETSRSVLLKRPWQVPVGTLAWIPCLDTDSLCLWKQNIF